LTNRKIENEADVRDVIELMRMNCERAVVVQRAVADAVRRSADAA
jgi:hypothetical protein